MPTRPFAACAAACLSLAPLFAALWGVDPRLLDGASVWAKPFKFAVGFGLHFAVLAAVAARLPPAPLVRRAHRAGAVALALELGWIVLQAARGQRSHFNTDTPLHALMYFGVMGGSALVLVGISAAVGWAVLRAPAPRMAPGLRLGATVGLLAGSALTLLTAGFLAQAFSHHVGTPPPGAAALPVVGWSRAVGDLRISHFLATHGMQLLPLAGLLVDRVAPRRARPLVWAVAAAWAAAVLATFTQALRGAPLLAG